MEKIYFVTGSQDLYGENVLKLVAEDSKTMAEFLHSRCKEQFQVEYLSTVKNSDAIFEMSKTVNNDSDCVGVIVWMHTFSPAKMWIRGLLNLKKPLLHLHTQANEKLPYSTIDMDFMNLNQAAHGDREFGFMASRLKTKRTVVSGFYRHDEVVSEILNWGCAAKAYAFSQNLKVARFGDNMREVAVTEGDKVEAQIKFGWQVNGYGIGDLVSEFSKITDKQIESVLKEMKTLYTFNTDNIAAVKEQIKYEIAFKSFFKEKDISAYTDTFQDLEGLKQLPGLAAQRMMAEGIGFGAEGDWKTAALGAVMNKMAEGKEGATGFMEDYTYDLTQGEEVVLGAHMLEVPVSFAADKPSIEVHPLGIGGKEAPARLVFGGITGEGIAVSIVDLGDRFRMIVAEIELIQQKQPMPNLPVARIMWKIKPSHKIGTMAWILCGGAHHTVVSTAINSSDMRLLAEMYGIECVVIDKNTEINSLKQQLMLSDVIYKQ